jgi:hypothetical protein
MTTEEVRAIAEAFTAKQEMRGHFGGVCWAG